MKIRHIEFEEKYLTEFGIQRSTYNSATGKKGCVQHRLCLMLKIPDDFNLLNLDYREIYYYESDFNDDVQKLDNYIESLKRRLNSIILQNGSK